MRYLIRFVLCASLFALAAPAWAAPFVVADSYVAPAVIPDSFKYALDGGAEVSVPPFSGTMADGTVLVNTVHVDVGSVAVGAHTISVKACKAATIWNPEVCSAPVPFTFTRPGAPVAPSAPTGIGLASQ